MVSKKDVYYVIVSNVLHVFKSFGFQPHHGVPAQIAEIINGKYPRACPTWGDVPSELRDF